MKIKLTRTLPVDPAHGMTQGRELEIAFEHPYVKGKREPDAPLWFVMSDLGEPVGVFVREADLLDRPDKAACPDCGQETASYDLTGGWFCQNEECRTGHFTLFPEPEANDESNA